MRTFICFGKLYQDFDAKKHCLNDHGAISFKMQHAEGEVAKLTVMLPEINMPNEDEKWVYLSILNPEQQATKLLFCGMRLGVPKWVDRGLVEISYYALPNNYQKKLEHLVEINKSDGKYDGLFFDEDDPSNILEGREEIFYWDRCGKDVGLSNIFKGSRAIDLTNFVWENSLSVKFLKSFLSAVEMTVSAEWIQQAKGAINIFGKIAGAFSMGIINSITPQALEKYWPKEGDRIGKEGSEKKTGYRVIESSLEEFNPGSSGALNVYPTITSPLLAKDGDAFKKICFARKWFKGRLTIMWNYAQRRQENIKFTIHQRVPKNCIFTSVKKLCLHLPGVHKTQGISDKSSFFTDARGHKAIAYAIEVAKSYLHASTRCLEICFEFDWKNADHLDLDTEVMLQHKSLPNGMVRGKVSAYRFVQDGCYRRGWVKMLAVLEQVKLYGAENTLGEDDVTERTSSGIKFGCVYDKKPEKGLIDAANLSCDDIVQSVRVYNDGEEQSRVLREKQYPIVDHPKQVLREIPTTIELDLADMRTERVMVHNIEVPIFGI